MNFKFLNFTFVHKCKFHVYMMVLTFLYDRQHIFSNFKFCNCMHHVYYTTPSVRLQVHQVPGLSTCIQILNLEKQVAQHLYAIVGLYAHFYMFLCSNPYFSMICMIGFYDSETGFFGM
jgi:hypothetical protein